jgi:hemoglobin/transferrin/lactoferrin receptor protein
VLFIAGVLLWAGAAGADRIEQIVVVAHKDERSIRDIAANVTTLSRAELKDDLATSINDVFRYVPGVDYEAAGTRFGSEGINIRGIGGNRVAILVDGVPLSDQFDIGSFSNATRDFLDAGLIENIEVLHGPASALYGSSAIGGVVAVRTPDPFDLLAGRGFGGDAIVTWRGNDASAHAQAMAAVGNRDLGLLLGASWRDGEQTDSAAADISLDTRDYKRRTALAKLVGDDRWGNTWRASYIRQDSHTLSDMRSLLGSGRFRSTTALRGDDRYGLDALNLSYDFSSSGRLFDDGLLRVYYQAADIEQFTLDERAAASTPVSIDRLFVFEQDSHGVEMNAWKDLTTGTLTHRLGLGVEYAEHQTEEYRDGLSTDLVSGAQTSVLLGEVFPLRDFPLSKTRETSAFIEDSMSIGNVTIIAALRADRFQLSPEADAMYLEDYPFADPVSLDESELSPKLGLIVAIQPDIDMYVQYSHGFRAPPYSDANIGLELPLFNIRAVPNPDLRSESSDGVDVGLRLMRANSEARLSVFSTRYEDFIESKVNLGFDPVSGRVLFQSQNLSATRIEGIEGAWSLRFGGDRRAFGLDVSAYYARGENKDNGEPLNSVGPPQAVAGFSWFSADERRQARIRATFTDGWTKRDESTALLFKPPGYAIFDLYLVQQLGKRSTLRAGLHNLTDRTYWHWADIRGLSPTDPMIPYLARAGRSVSVSVNVNW